LRALANSFDCILNPVESGAGVFGYSSD
jgi:hypothetical protein